MIGRFLSFVKKKIIMPVVYYAAVLLPVKKNKVVFDNFSGRGYGCNPKYIAQALLEKKENLDFVWLVNDMSEEMPGGIRKVKYRSLRSAYELATARVWIDNVRSSFRVKKKKSQYYIQTWHCSIGLKKSEKEVEDSLSKEYVRAAKRDGSITDLMISNGAYRTKRYYDNFWYQGKVLECGFPRYDILVDPKAEVKTKLYQYFGIPENKKLVLYAPTFRNQTGTEKNSTDIYQFNYEKCCRELEKKFGGEYVLLLRLHPNVAKRSSSFAYSDNVYNATYYPDMQELLAFSDVLITDYSSCMFDSMYAGHKVFLFAKDASEYALNERTLLFTFEQLPCSLSMQESELYSEIRRFDEKSYRNTCKEFFKAFDMNEPGTASETVAKLVIQKIREA